MIKNLSFLSIALLVIFLTILGLPLDLMPPDAALYGTISKDMFLNNDYINLYSLGKDWLDKPHLPFWLTALSFKIFGISSFSYRLPALITFSFGVYMTYLFTKKAYNKETAIFASIILITSLHTVISNFDVRAEPYLTTFVIGGVYFLYQYIEEKKFSSILIGSLFCALGVMTKGIFALIPIASAVGGHLLVKKKWKEILNPMWLVAFLLIFIFITPELYALYKQFDAQPEKLIFNRTNVSGIQFFLWDSQFGRFFNTGPIKGKGDIFFFIHTILWAFLPWSILFYIAIVLKIKRNRKKIQQEEFYSVFATLATILVFSLSKFQLAHYTNIIFPFMAILTADFVVKIKNQYKGLLKTFKISQSILIGISLIAVFALGYIMKPDFNFQFIWVLILCIGAIYIIRTTVNSFVNKLFYFSSIAFCFLYGFMLTHFYPTLFNYQGGVNAAKYSNTNLSDKNVYLIDNNAHNFGFEFYLNSEIKRVKYEDLKDKNGDIFYVNKNDLAYLDDNNIKYTFINTFDHYRITKLKGNFLNYKTRSKNLDKRHLIKID